MSIVRPRMPRSRGGPPKDDRHRLEAKAATLGRTPDLASGGVSFTYSDDEREFLGAMDDFIRRTGRKFPRWSDALGVLKGLGYRKG